MKTPSNKLLRELKRLVRQFIDAPSALGEYLFATKYYDKVIAKKTSITTGTISISDRIAIYVIFPKCGVEEKHLHALRYINGAGYSAVVVVNGRLANAEKEELLQLCSKLIERENFGYDFGGYREGLLFIRSLTVAPKFVAILNDSCWFPSNSNANWLHEAESLNVELASALTFSGSGWVKRALASSGDSFHAGPRRSKRLHHCSFAILFSRAALERSDFWDFWRSLHLSSRRDRTVKWGERALSEFAVKNNLTQASTLPEQVVARALFANLGEAVLNENEHPAYKYKSFLVSRLNFQFYKVRGRMGDEIDAS
jgi:lipopolysaccharide biosynthesis protein